MSAAHEMDLLINEIFPILPPELRKMFLRVDWKKTGYIEEIRMRCNQPLIIRNSNQEYGLDPKAGITAEINRSYQVSGEDIMRTIAAISDNSLYAFEEDIRKGFITISGGHRVGLAGQVVMQDTHIKAIKEFSSICIRIAREIRDSASGIMNSIYAPANKVRNSLLVSPPRCGKTTLLRDIARSLSSGSRQHKGRNVVIVDERSELAGCYLGIPQLDVGPRTDVLDSCTKAAGMIIAVRAMSPEVVITDELGRKEDVVAVQECLNAGVSIISSIHAGSIEELQNRPIMKDLINSRAFKNIILLSRNRGPGTVEKIVRWD
ncbi:stage iii sporulation protein aa [hydrocarbon metagenome]|uniref:Stage iii sporulation protein aa n=1 Tax=hydrocarbon metagenome TaxID=938273 RepID=A0A0W8E9A2_9ZZZZ